MTVIVKVRKKRRSWLDKAAQQLLDQVSEQFEDSQEKLLAGIRCRLRALLKELRPNRKRTAY